MRLPTPGQHRKYNRDKRRFRGSIKAEMRRFLQRTYPRRAFPGMEMVLQPEPQTILSTMASFLMSNAARLGIMQGHRLEARDAISCERRATFAPWTIVLQLPKIFPLLSGQ